MVTRVGKFVGGFNQDVTNTTNAHATENRVAFGHGDTNPTANVHVVGNILATTTVTRQVDLLFLMMAMLVLQVQQMLADIVCWNRCN